jgi:glycerophosphoryl diester phosphodiesterase
MQQGADFVEPDLVMTKDGVLVARHENEIGETTDVAGRPEFAGRRTSKVIDGKPVAGWFTEDFTLAELKTLRARERIPRLRSANARFDGMFPVPTFEEVLSLVGEFNSRGGRQVGVYPETKHPSYFAGIGLAMEEPLVKLLERFGHRGKAARVFIQSFEVGNLKKLARMTDLPLIQLMNDSGQPWDFSASGERRTYRDMATPQGLAEIASYARGIGPHKNLVIPRTPAGALGTPTALVKDAHAKGLAVHPWTFRVENSFLPKDLQSGGEAAAPGDLAGEIERFLAAGVDGIFTDQPDFGVRARERK